MDKHQEDYLNQLRHSTAHLLAAAVLDLYPDTKQTIGPAIENGFYYDFEFQSPISEDELPKIEKKMSEILKTWDHFEHREVTPDEAKALFPNNEYKHELIDQFASEGQTLTVYQSGEYVDLCRGGHIENPRKEIGAFKLLSLAGAYWRGDENNKMLSRIYGTAFPNQAELDAHLQMLEEAKLRDHRTLAKQLEIYTISDEVGQGLILWLPNGTVIRQELEQWARETEKEWGYVHVSTPHITKRHLYEISGHLPYYADDLYSPIDIEGEEYYLKPMNCPHHHMIYQSRGRSYRELPLRVAEYGQVYRFERSGTLHGLMRTRGFCQNDAHIYVKPEEAVQEFISVFNMHKYYYEKLGIASWWVVLGLRDKENLRKKYHGDDKMWDEAEHMTRDALDQAGVKYEIEEGGAAHYGPKGDIYVKSVIGKEYAIGTTQLDLFMPQRFNLEYTDVEGNAKMPFVIHRAPLGSHERMIGFLLEHYAGAFPVWLHPIQVRILPIGADHREYAEKVKQQLLEAAPNARIEIDATDETLQKRIRNAQLMKVPYMAVVGGKEAAENQVSIRLRSGEQRPAQSVGEFASHIAQQIRTKSLDL